MTTFSRPQSQRQSQVVKDERPGGPYGYIVSHLWLPARSMTVSAPKRWPFMSSAFTAFLLVLVLRKFAERLL